MNTLTEIISERGTLLIYLNNIKFYKQIILKSGEEKWRCENKKCSTMCKTEIAYMDGTFTYCVKHFLQLFTVHGYLNGHYVLLCFCVLKDKHVSSYIEYFKTINYNNIISCIPIAAIYKQQFQSEISKSFLKCSIKQIKGNSSR